MIYLKTWDLSIKNGEFCHKNGDLTIKNCGGVMWIQCEYPVVCCLGEVVFPPKELVCISIFKWRILWSDGWNGRPSLENVFVKNWKIHSDHNWRMSSFNKMSSFMADHHQVIIFIVLAEWKTEWFYSLSQGWNGADSAWWRPLPGTSWSSMIALPVLLDCPSDLVDNSQNMKIQKKKYIIIG